MHGGRMRLFISVVIIAGFLRWSQGQATLPSKDYCEYEGQIIPNRHKIVLKTDPCIRCRCRKGELECRTKTCPQLKCKETVHKPGTCCPKCVISSLNRSKNSTRADNVAVTMGLDITSDGLNQIITLRLPPPPMIPPPPPSVLAAAMLGNNTVTRPVVVTTPDAPPIEPTIVTPRVTVRVTRAPPTPPPTPPPPAPDMTTIKTTPTPPTPVPPLRPTPEAAWNKWCAKGEPGPQGFKGEPGYPGSPGMQGTPGTEGPTGSSGLKGDRGDQGSQGLKGEPGPQGMRGLQGPRGPIGPKGSFGLPGPSGTPGKKGPQGKNGKRGRKGDPGQQGPVGPEGPAGLPGHVGLPGPVGPSGMDGAPGPSGPMGPVGPRGLSGFPGSAGAPGSRGLKGDKGDPGNRIMEGRIIIVPNELAMNSIQAEAALVYRMDDKKLYFRDTEDWNCLMTEDNMKGIHGSPGPPGPPGDMGPPGPKGPKGDKGDYGEYNGEEICGNFLIEGKEQCDDGNDIDSDSCIYCRRSYCGDGYRQEGVEECDTFDFNGRTCDDYFTEYETMGTLRCTDRCRIDTGDCKVVRRRKRQLPPDD